MFKLEVQIEFWPKARDDLNWVGVDRVDKGLTTIEQRAHGSVAMVVGHFFPHPFPESLDGIEVRAIAREWQEGETEVGSFSLNDLCSVTRCPIPDDDNRAGERTQPVGETA